MTQTTSQCNSYNNSICNNSVVYNSLHLPMMSDTEKDEFTSFQQDVYKFPPYLKCVVCYTTLWNANVRKWHKLCKNTMKSYHMFNQLLTMSQNLLKISAFNLHTNSQICVPLVSCQQSSIIFILTRTALSHTDSATPSSFQHHSSHHQIKEPQHQPSRLHYLWHCLIACLAVLCVQNVNM